jgi:hypothetical protein
VTSPIRPSCSRSAAATVAVAVTAKTTTTVTKTGATTTSTTTAAATTASQSSLQPRPRRAAPESWVFASWALQRLRAKSSLVVAAQATNPELELLLRGSALHGTEPSSMRPLHDSRSQRASLVRLRLSDVALGHLATASQIDLLTLVEHLRELFGTPWRGQRRAWRSPRWVNERPREFCAPQDRHTRR